MIGERKAAPKLTEQQNGLAGGHVLPSSAPCDRRRETRYATNDPVEVRLLEAGGSEPVAGKVLDVSRSGLRLEISTPISKGLRLEIVLPDRAVIFGESRYCRRVSSCYQVGVAIEVVCCAQKPSSHHILDDQLALYVAGKGLSALEAMHVKNHLLTCASCGERLIRADMVRRRDSGQG